MKQYLVADRYARALLKSVGDPARYDQALECLGTMAEIFETHHEFRNTLSNPSIRLRRRHAVLSEVMDASGLTTDEVKRLLDVMMLRGRITLLPVVAQVFEQIVDEALGRAEARVATPLPLDDEEQARIEASLALYFNKSIRLDCTVDADLLGGAVAQVGGTVIDGSVRARLNRLRAAVLAEEG